MGAELESWLGLGVGFGLVVCIERHSQGTRLLSWESASSQQGVPVSP